MLPHRRWKLVHTVGKVTECPQARAPSLCHTEQVAQTH